MEVFVAPAKNQEDQEARQAAKEAKAKQAKAKPEQPVKRGIRPGKKLDTGDAMPRTDLRRPNPLDSEVIMDATARLLAPRRVTLTPAPTASSPKKARNKPKLQSKAPAKTPNKTKPAPQPKAQTKPRPQAQMPRRGRAPEPQRPRAKDSTEQPSLMKPFYINMGD